jgi:hypothetical protein
MDRPFDALPTLCLPLSFTTAILLTFSLHRLKTTRLL